jgi:DNA-binding response OmpR family regulator
VNRFEVVTAASCTEAKRQLAANSYHLVITDLNMEKQTSGLDVLRYAREQQYHPAVAILTAYPELASDWKERGADSLFIKPTNMPELLEEIEALLAGQRIKKKKTPIRAKGTQLPSGATTSSLKQEPSGGGTSFARQPGGRK